MMKEEKMELWIVEDDNQLRLRNRKQNDSIQLTFWKPNGEIKHFTAEYQKLLEILENADSNLYNPKPL